MKKERLLELAGIEGDVVNEGIDPRTETALNQLIEHGNKHFGSDDKTWAWVARELHNIIDYHP